MCTVKYDTDIKIYVVGAYLMAWKTFLKCITMISFL